MGGIRRRRTQTSLNVRRIDYPQKDKTNGINKSAYNYLLNRRKIKQNWQKKSKYYYDVKQNN